jgi:long-chain acyl-CoA synthetase
MSNELAVKENYDMGELDTFPKILRHNAKNWPTDIAMRLEA